MKSTLLPIISAGLIGTVALSADAQSFVNLRISEQQTNVSLTVPTNTLARFHGFVGNAGAKYTVTVPGFDPSYPGALGNPPSGGWQSVLGPCEIALSGNYSTYTNWFAQLLVELQPVNVAPSTSPAVVYSVQTSTNLADWQTITNATFPRSEPQRFFRSALAVP